MVRKRLHLFYILAAILVTMIFLTLFSKSNDTKVVYKVQEEASPLFRVFYSHFVDDAGGVYTNLRNDVPKAPGTATGHQMLSESTGLMMLYALRKGDQALFDQQLDFLNRHLLTNNGLIRWMVDPDNNSYDASSNASIDDLRIIRALREADQMWEDKEGSLYRNKAEQISAALKEHNITGGLLTDYFEWKFEQPADSVTSSYLDVRTIKELAEKDNDWKAVYDSSLHLLREAALPNGMFKKTYKLKTGEWEPLETVHMVDTLYCAFHLAEDGQDVSPTIRLIEAQMEASGKLYGRLYPDGTPDGNLESPAVYALALRTVNLVNPDHLMVEKLEQRLKELAVSDLTSIYAGAYVNLPDQEGYSFDHLQVLLTEHKEQLS